jgi:hypothetical protein
VCSRILRAPYTPPARRTDRSNAHVAGGGSHGGCCVHRASIRSMASEHRPAKAALTAALLSAVAATVISAIFICVAFAIPSGGVHWSQVLQCILVMCLFTMFPAGSFGFIVGGLGGLWWSYRGQRLRPGAHFVTEAAGVGVLLSLPFSIFRRSMRWGSGNEPWFDAGMTVFSAAVGSISAVLVALALRGLLGRNPSLGAAPSPPSDQQ